MPWSRRWWSCAPDIQRITNNAKVTDHHAIIPTVQLEKQDISALPESEQKILRLVAMRLLSATVEKHPKFEVYTDKAGEFRFRLKATNGQIIAVSEGYKAIASCMNGIESVKKNAVDAPVVRAE